MKGKPDRNLTLILVEHTLGENKHQLPLIISQIREKHSKMRLSSYAQGCDWYTSVFASDNTVKAFPMTL